MFERLPFLFGRTYANRFRTYFGVSNWATRIQSWMFSFNSGQLSWLIEKNFGFDIM
jgi:hypothetical protein